MKTYLILLSLLFLSFMGYAYAHNPAQCWVVIGDFGELAQSMVPVKIEMKGQEAPAEASLPTAPAKSEAPPRAAP